MDIVKTFQLTLVGVLWLRGRDGLSPRQARQYFRYGMRPDCSLCPQVTARFRRSISCRHQKHPANRILQPTMAALPMRHGGHKEGCVPDTL